MHVWRSLVYFTLVSPYLIFVCLASSFQEPENFHPAVEYDQGPNLEEGPPLLPLFQLFRHKRALDGIRQLANGKLLFPLGGSRRSAAGGGGESSRRRSKSQRRNGEGGGGGNSGILNNLCLRENQRRTQSGLAAVGTTSIMADDYGTSNSYAQDASRNSASSARAQAIQHGNTGVSYATTDNKDFHQRQGLLNTLLCAVQIETILQPIAAKKKKQKSKKRRNKKRKRTTTTTTTTTAAPAPAEYEDEEEDSEAESSEESNRRKRRFIQLPLADELQVAEYVQRMRELKSE